MDSLDHIIEAEYYLGIADRHWRGKYYDKEIESLKLVKEYIEKALIEAEKELKTN